MFSTVNWGNRLETDKDLSLWIDVDSKQIYIYETSACGYTIYKYIEYNLEIEFSWNFTLGSKIGLQSIYRCVLNIIFLNVLFKNMNENSLPL